MDTLIYFIFSFAVYIQISDSAYSCDQSIPTIAYVTSCPKNKTEWDIAARRKKCESLADQQSCTSADNFQYHCLENQQQNMALEICAPIFYLQGYCAKYNTEKKRVEENYENGFECLKFDESEKCPSRYPSTDAYKYQRCYKLKYQNPTQTACPICTSPSPQSGTTPKVTKEDLGSDTDDSIKTVFLVILALALAGVIVLILFYKRESLNLEKFCKATQERTDLEEGSGAQAGLEGQQHEVHESLPLLTEETGPDQQDLAVVSNSSSSATPFTSLALASAPISSDDIGVSHSSSIDVSSPTPIVGDDPEKPNSDTDIVSNTDNVPTSEQTSDIVIASQQKPVDDTSLKPKPDNETASIHKSDTFLDSTSNSDTERCMKTKPDDRIQSNPKSIDVSLSQEKSDAKNTSKPSKSKNEPTETSILGNNKTENLSRDANEKTFKENPSKSNDGHNMNPVSNEKIASHSTSLEAPASRPVSNGKSAADSASTSHKSSNNAFPLKSTNEETKTVVMDHQIAISTGMPAESSESLSFDKSSSSLSKNTFGSKEPDNSVTSSDNISKNRTAALKPILQDQAAAISTSKDVPASDDAHVSTLSTDNPAPALSNRNPPPASKPMSANNPFEEDATPSALSDKDFAPNDSFISKPGNNPFNEDTPSSDAGDNTSPNDSTALKTVPKNDEDITCLGFGKLKRAPGPPLTNTNVTQNPSTPLRESARFQLQFPKSKSISRVYFAPDSIASKPMSANNPFEEDATPSALSDKDFTPNDSTILKPGNNPFDEDTPSSDAGDNTSPNDSTALKTVPKNDEDIARLGFGKLKRAPGPPLTNTNEPQNPPLEKKRSPPPPRPLPPGQPKKS